MVSRTHHESLLTNPGYGGHCYNQTCQAGSWQDTAGAWYRSNLQISIPVTIVAALLVSKLLMIEPC